MEPIFVSLRCPCGNTFDVSAGPPGTEVDCPACGKKVAFPAPAPPKPEPAKPAAPPAAENALGKVALDKGWIKPDQLDAAVKLRDEAAARGESLRLGEALVKLGFLAPEQVRQALLTQDKVTMRCPTCRKNFNVRGFKPGTQPLCKTCKVPLVILTSPSGLHVSDTNSGAQRAPAGAPVDPSLADLIPGYTIERCLGSGGMGDVYLARQTSLDRLVAVKTLPPELAKNQTYVERFLSEARSAGKLTQENIVAAVDAGESKGRYYFVMEYVEGETLQDIIKRDGALPEKRALEIARQVAVGLRHAHKHDLIHRDIKPANIMIAVDGTAKICDFGLAKQIDDTDVGLTQPGMVHSSPAYASPEQCRGRRDIDHRSDMYSLGVTLFESLTGKRPFGSESTGELFIQHATDQPPAPKSLNSSLSSEANKLVLRLLRKAPEGRYLDYDDLIAAIDGVIRPGQGAAEAPAAATEAPVPATRNPLFIKIGAGAAAAVLLVVLLVFFLGGSDSDESTVPSGDRVQAQLAELRNDERAAATDPTLLPDIHKQWKALAKEYKGTAYYPAFDGGLRDFENRLRTNAEAEADRLLKQADALAGEGKEAEALDALLGYPLAYGETDAGRRVAGKVEELQKAQAEKLARSLAPPAPDPPAKTTAPEAPKPPPADTPPPPVVSTDPVSPELRKEIDKRLAVMNFGRLAAVYCQLKGKKIQASQIRLRIIQTKGEIDAFLAPLRRAGGNPVEGEHLLPNDQIVRFQDQDLAQIGPSKAAELLGAFLANAKGGSEARLVRVRGGEKKELTIRFDDRSPAIASIGEIAGLSGAAPAPQPSAKVAKNPTPPPPTRNPAPPPPPRNPNPGAAPPPAQPFAPRPEAPPEAPLKKHPEPDDATQKDAEALIREIYESEYAKRTAPEIKALAEILLKRAAETHGEVEVRYVLLREARDLAAQAGDSVTALAAIDEMAAAYEIEPVPMKLEALAKAASSTRDTDELSKAAQGYLNVVEQAIKVDDYDAAASAASKGFSVARASRDRSVAERAAALRKNVSTLRTEYRKVRKWIENPGTGGDQKAGEFLSFVKGDWERGLPLLTKGSDASLKAIAEKDLANPGDPKEQAEVGHGWWEIAEKERNSLKKSNLLGRVRLWYERAIPFQTGISKLKMQKRLEEIESSNSVPRISGPLVKGIKYDYFEGMIRGFRDFEGLKPAKSGTQSVIDVNARRRLAQYGFRFTGFLLIRRGGTYTFTLDTDDGSRLLIDEKLVVDNGGFHMRRQISGKVSLQPGYHPFTIEYFQGGGPSYFDIVWEGPGFSRSRLPSSSLFHTR